MKFKLQLGEISNDYRATAGHRFYSDAFWTSEEDGYLYYVDGVSVTRLEALASAQSAMDSAFDKKLETHKRVSVSQGASTLSNTRKDVWVKR